jgi:hypothetical protein
MAHSPSHFSSSSDSGATDAFLDAPQPASLTVVQTVNIRNHIPVLLELAKSNYSQWWCLIDSVLGKFGLVGHVRSPPLIVDCDIEWCQVDCCIVNWIYNTVTKSVFDLIYKPDATTFTIWSDVENLFRDNELQQAVLLEAEFCSVVQGDLTISDYCHKLKKLADNLRDIRHPVSEPSQVLNLLRGLNSRFRHVKTVLTSKTHTFMSARSYLLLDELQLEQEDKQAAGQAMLANHGGSAGSSGSAAHGGSGAGGHSTADNTGNRGFKQKNKRRGRAPSNGSGSSSDGSGAPQRPQSPWTTSYNPWTGLVQPWQMPFRALLTVKFRQPSHEFTFDVGMNFVSYPLVLAPVV